MDQDFTATASMLFEPTRATMLLKLMSGRALPAGELALAANVSPQTASGHLAQLMDSHFVSVERQGRHRYYRLATAEVAHAVEALMALVSKSSSHSSQTASPVAGTLPYARTCYSHLAGWLSIRLLEALQKKDFLRNGENRSFILTEGGTAWFECLGITVPPQTLRSARKIARPCLDWTERTPHLAGTLGVSLYKRLLELGWLAPVPGSRAVRVTHLGKQNLWKHLQLRAG